MRWASLFDDLEAEFEAAERDQFEAEVADRVRREVAATSVADRLRAAVGHRVELGLDGGMTVAGTVVRCGADWTLVAVVPAAELLVPMAAVITARGLPLGGGSDRLAARIRLGVVLREISRDRRPVTVGLRGGEILAGTIDRVGADYLELAEHALDEPRRPAALRGIRLIATAAIACLRSTY